MSIADSDLYVKEPLHPVNDIHLLCTSSEKYVISALASGFNIHYHLRIQLTAPDVCLFSSHILMTVGMTVGTVFPVIKM